jgi:hypothetical protein
MADGDLFLPVSVHGHLQPEDRRLAGLRNGKQRAGKRGDARHLRTENIAPNQVVLHSDNGSPMKGAYDAGHAAKAWGHAIIQSARVQ